MPATLSFAQLPPAEIQEYAIDMAGIRIGSLTATRQPLAGNRVTYTQISEVNIKLLVYTITIYYKVVSHYEGNKLLLATVDTRSNRGNYSSRTEWKGNHYVITANQYKYDHKATEHQPIDHTLSLLFFGEPTGRTRIFSEYFGDYFTVSRTPDSNYLTVLNDREDEYIYENGRLVRVIKHNKVKNFILRRLK